MIGPDTPYKLAEIIRDTWPGLYRPFKKQYNYCFDENKNEKRIQSNTETREEN